MIASMIICDRCGRQEPLGAPSHVTQIPEMPQRWASIQPAAVTPVGEPPHFGPDQHACPNCLTQGEKEALAAYVSGPYPF